MPRFRSLSTNTPPRAQTSPVHSGTSSPALLTRGFRSLRRARRQSSSVPSSPMPAITHSTSRLNDSSPLENSAPLRQLESAPLSSSSSVSSHHDHDDTTHGPHIRLIPNVGIGNRCFVFDIIDRELQPGVVLKIGRYSDRNVAPDRLSFKSKVVSRSHAELWVPPDSSKIYIRDVGSSSGTFVNRARLSPAGVRSSTQEIKDGDLIQLGVDYQGGIEPMYRAVRIRLEVNREQAVSHPFSRQAFQQLRSHLLAAVAPTAASATSRHQEDDEDEVVVVDHAPYPNNLRANHALLLDDHDDEKKSPHTMPTTVRGSPVVNQSDIQECCICLYAIAPFQALFIAPCSHIFHFKCLRPILFQNYPGFSCPICRTYSDLEASVAVEVSDVLETLGLSSSAPPEVPEEIQEAVEEEEDEDEHHPLQTFDTVHQEENHRSQPREPEALSVPSRSSNQRSAGEGLLSSTLVATPPTFEEMLTASSVSPAPR
ncbi:hypothetical protein BJV82DRAFT_607626 [Fennellomyces sp. T-0311]|nr:hypothetical protein BJV82DRAFT_607626 [Fennellomyces sp. T-0311]